MHVTIFNKLNYQPSINIKLYTDYGILKLWCANWHSVIMDNTIT